MPQTSACPIGKASRRPCQTQPPPKPTSASPPLTQPTAPLPGITAGVAPTEPAPVCPATPVPRAAPSPRHVVPHAVHPPQVSPAHVSELSPPGPPIGPEDTTPGSPSPTGMPAPGAQPLQFTATTDHHEDMYVHYTSTPRRMSPANSRRPLPTFRRSP
ncbi:vegetative cell wall protein gp1-like [Homarus americanus]|uniref:vegetative cell wall protein gp1-like n=1 Tax=Homarus americanus TaxID=6706 RepID=UPI001C480F61|nr:vegetative cell wall protein gp1-like [Homarus americanus]